MRGSAVVTLLIAFVVLVFGAGVVDAQLNQNWDPSGPGGSCPSNCNYCCQESCGCSAPPAGYYFSGWCACSSITCNRTCSYSPNRS